MLEKNLRVKGSGCILKNALITRIGYLESTIKNRGLTPVEYYSELKIALNALQSN